MPDASANAGQPTLVHASCVAYDGAAALIVGSSGSGKSGLALCLMGLGAQLVSDDQTQVRRAGDVVLARAPEAISGLIEARGVGLLRAQVVQDVPVSVVIDMDIQESERLPEPHTSTVLGVELRCLHKVDMPYFPAAILQYLQCGRKHVP